MTTGIQAPDARRWTTVWARAGGVEALLSYIVAGSVAVAAVVVAGDELGHHIDAVESWISGLGPGGPAMYVLAYALLSSIFVPDVILGIVAGATFGFAEGVALAAAGGMCGAALQYGLARWLLQPAIDRWVAGKPALVALQTAVRRQQLRLQLLIRLTPLNRALTSYLLGAAGVGFGRFAAACVALVPSLCLEVYFGYAGKHVARLASQSGRSVVLHDVVLLAGLATAAAVMVVVSRAARRALEAATESVAA